VNLAEETPEVSLDEAVVVRLVDHGEHSHLLIEGNSEIVQALIPVIVMLLADDASVVDLGGDGEDEPGFDFEAA
jgi:hypothetical protein